MRALIAAFAGAVVLSTAALSGQQVIFTPNGILPVLDSYLEALRLQAAIPGMSAAVVKDGVIIWEKGYGFQNVASRVRATPDTPYLVGDASGMLAAVLLLQCVEQRHLELDRPLNAYGIQIADGDATLRQLLSHTSAVSDVLDQFTYSPSRYSQLTGVMEWCAPQPYRKSVSHRILNHLAMRDSAPGTDLRDANLPLPQGLYDPSELARYRSVLARMAIPYRVDTKGRAEQVTHPIASMSASGGLVTTVRDLAKLDAALDERALLLEETLAVAWQPTLTSRGTATPFGLGWFVQPYRDQRVVWHFGIVPNAYASLIIKLPDHNLTFILLANSERLNSPFQLQLGDVTKSLFAQLFLKLVTGPV